MASSGSFVIAEGYLPKEEIGNLTQRHVLISSFRSWSDFSVVTTETDELLNETQLENKLKIECEDVLSLNELDMISVGVPCAVKDSGERWLRGQILNVDRSSGRCKISFVDKGGAGIFHFKDIKPLPKHLAELCPPTAHDCRIKEDDRADLPDEPDTGFENGVFLLFMEVDGEDVFEVTVTHANIRVHDVEEDEEFAAKRRKKARNLDSKKDKGGVNRKTVMTYERCMVLKAHATCLEVESRQAGRTDRNRGGGQEKVLVYAEQCSLHGGSLSDAMLNNLFRSGDTVEVSAHLQVDRDETTDARYEEWIARDMHEPALSHYLRYGRYPDKEFVTHGVIMRIENGFVWIRSRLFDLNIRATIAAFGQREGKPTEEKKNLSEAAPLHRTVAVRVRVPPRQQRKDTIGEAVSVEVFKHIEDEGILYLVAEEYCVILRTRECEGYEGERLECRYVFAPNSVVESNGIGKDDWYGRPVMFSACEDQPDMDESSARRWRAFWISLLNDPSDSKRGNYRYAGIWRPKPLELGAVGGARKKLEDDVEGFDLPRGTLQEWNREGLGSYSSRSTAPISSAGRHFMPPSEPTTSVKTEVFAEESGGVESYRNQTATSVKKEYTGVQEEKQPAQPEVGLLIDFGDSDMEAAGTVATSPNGLQNNTGTEPLLDKDIEETLTSERDDTRFQGEKGELENAIDQKTMEALEVIKERFPERFPESLRRLMADFERKTSAAKS